LDAKRADQLGERIRERIEREGAAAGARTLAPRLSQRIPFRYLDRVGLTIGQLDRSELDPFLDLLSGMGTEGGWVVIGAALRTQLTVDLEAALARCRAFVRTADTWYGADILGERVPGPSLLSAFDPSMHQLEGWREDPNRWVRRSLGVGVHFWAKRAAGREDFRPRAAALLDFLSPLFEEWDMDAAKGIGWGLKTLGKHYPELVTGWLLRQKDRRHRAVLRRKALTYLPEEARGRIERAFL
jgi:3-methyladenine DNA glycosylase AlkD